MSVVYGVAGLVAAIWRCRMVSCSGACCMDSCIAYWESIDIVALCAERRK